MFTIEQLKEYTTSTREQITSLETQIAKAKQQESQINGAVVPSKDEIKSFAEESAKTLSDLSFELKRAIVTNVVEKIIATQQKLEVSGCTSITLNHVAYKTSNRNSGLT